MATVLRDRYRADEAAPGEPLRNRQRPGERKKGAGGLLLLLGGLGAGGWALSELLEPKGGPTPTPTPVPTPTPTCPPAGGSDPTHLPCWWNDPGVQLGGQLGSLVFRNLLGRWNDGEAQSHYTLNIYNNCDGCLDGVGTGIPWVAYRIITDSHNEFINRVSARSGLYGGTEDAWIRACFEIVLGRDIGGPIFSDWRNTYVTPIHLGGQVISGQQALAMRFAGASNWPLPAGATQYEFTSRVDNQLATGNPTACSPGVGALCLNL